MSPGDQHSNKGQIKYDWSILYLFPTDWFIQKKKKKERTEICFKSSENVSCVKKRKINLYLMIGQQIFRAQKK